MVKKILGAVALIIVELAIIVGVFVIAQRRFPASSLPGERAAETAQATPIPSGKALWIYYGSSGDWKCTFQLLPARYEWMTEPFYLSTEVSYSHGRIPAKSAKYRLMYGDMLLKEMELKTGGETLSARGLVNEEEIGEAVYYDEAPLEVYVSTDGGEEVRIPLEKVK